MIALVALSLAVASAPVAGLAAGDRAAAQETATPVDCSFPVTATDATGTEVVAAEVPERVVVLGPSAAQTMWEIGAQEAVVGMPVNRYTSYLNGSESRANVVDEQGQPVPERVVAQEPDLVLAPNVVANESVESLRDRGLTVYRFEAATSLEDVYAKTRRTGQLVGHYERADRVSAEMAARVDAVRQTVADEDRPRVYYAMAGGWTAGDGSFVDSIVTAAGGDNVAAGHLEDPYGALSDEVVVEEDPEWIVRNGDVPVPNTAAFNESTAVREDQVVSVSANYVNQPGPRNVIPLETMAEAFHPETSAAAETPVIDAAALGGCADAAAGSTATADGDGASPTTAGGEAETETANESGDAGTATFRDADEGTTAANGPGFGVLPAVGAALALSLFVLGRARD